MGDSLLKRAVKAKGVDALVAELGVEGLNRLRYEWEAWARPEQLAPPGDWNVWLLLAGRGFGKSRTGAEWVRQKVKTLPGSHGALVAPTSADARDVMVKALLDCTPPWEGLTYEPSKRALRWQSGTTATLYSAEEPDRLRGPQHHWAWCDEVAAWFYPNDVWDMLSMTLRQGRFPQICASTTPRPIELLNGSGLDGKRLGLIRMPTTVVTKGSTFDNADNLAAVFIDVMRAQYDGTRLGRQELYAEILDDVPGALWARANIDNYRVKEAPALERIVVAVDPAATSSERADETGIIVAGRKGGHFYVLADLTMRGTPDAWARIAVKAYHDWGADRIVAEVNNGGEMIEALLRTVDRSVAYRAVRATRGKAVRAEPVAALYEQGRGHHVGFFPRLEDQQCGYVPGQSDSSPDRADALVWAGHDLMLSLPASFGGEAFSSPKANVIAVGAEKPQMVNPMRELYGDFDDD